MLQKRFGFDPEMEKLDLTEKRKRKSDRMIPKSSPYHDPLILKTQVKKIALQNGTASPSEVGVELDPKKRWREKFSRNEI